MLALDQRGHGDTSWPAEPDYRTDDYVADLEALVEHWGIDRFVLIGLSMGGMNSIAYTARNPGRVTHLVPVDIPPAVDPSRRPNRDLDRQVAEGGHNSFADLDAAYLARKLTHPHTSEEAMRHHVRHLMKQGPVSRVVPKQDPRVSYHWQPSDLWEELPEVSVPVLIVRGGQSQVLPEKTAGRMRDAFPNAELLTIAEAGHTVPEDAPSRFIAAVRDFLARNPA